VDEDLFRNAFAGVPTAVSVVTTRDDGGRPYGLTVGSVGALSLSPPLVLFCLTRGSSTWRGFSTADRFLVNVLAADQQAVASRFASTGIDRFAGHHGEAFGLPAVPGALAQLLCARHAVHPGGDHLIIVGQVLEIRLHPGDPLVYCQRSYHALSTAPVPIAM
jgi:flavin reductase (DIM6/NTAB) family NADH-FMN oxidoreductase RutF